MQELTARLGEQGRYLAEHEFVAERLRSEAANARQVEDDVRAELAEVEDRQRETTESLRAERAALEEKLRQATEERAKLEREIATMKREAAARMPGTNGNHGNGERLFVPPAAQGEGKGSLADRIRALQTRASRIGQAS